MSSRRTQATTPTATPATTASPGEDRLKVVLAAGVGHLARAPAPTGVLAPGQRASRRAPPRELPRWRWNAAQSFLDYVQRVEHTPTPRAPSRKVIGRLPPNVYLNVLHYLTGKAGAYDKDLVAEFFDRLQEEGLLWIEEPGAVKEYVRRDGRGALLSTLMWTIKGDHGTMSDDFVNYERNNRWNVDWDNSIVA